jgi:tryptophan halogenase
MLIMNNKLNLVVLGGGTAGWITALFLRKNFPNFKIDLVQSKDIGIIGVGEATTPHIVSFLRLIDIDPIDVINYTSGSIKNGISFENWNGDWKKYFHSFSDKVVNFKIPNIFDSHCDDFYLKSLIHNNLDFEKHVYQINLAYQNKIDLEKTNWALHFDANKFADYLEMIGRNRGINVIEGNFKTAVNDEKGNIKTLILESGQQLNIDFVFDCSGFSRLLIGKHYNEKWISYSKYLPMKKAIPFWLENEEDKIEPYTSSIAMKYGWMWKIPLQHRTGSGYIFDSDYIDENQALDEAENFFHRKLKINKIIPFEAGKFENLWVNNCIAIGLSSSFIEPLESTSLFLSIGQLNLLKHFINEMFSPSLSGIKLFNEIVSNNMDDTLNFVYLHYITKRKDSNFWKDFKDKYPVPDKLKNLLSSLKENNIRYFDIDNTKTTVSFPQTSFLQVCNGLGIFESKINYHGYENISPSAEEYKKIIDDLAKGAIDHKLFLESIKNQN